MRCDGRIKRGSIFTFGITEWKQCTNDAIVIIKCVQGDEREVTLPSCRECWQRGIDTTRIKILEVSPIPKEK